MNIFFLIFCVSIFIVELFLVYSPLYLFAYKLANLDKKIGDGYLSLILLFISIIVSIIYFPIVYNLVGYYIVN